MEKNWIRNGKYSDPGWKIFGSGINVPDPQQWIETDCREMGDRGREAGGGGESTSLLVR
jgi:hypothetical protein